jgi:hypothetical protein
VVSMPIEALLLIIVIVEFVWIISSVFRSKEEERKRPGQRTVPLAPAPSSASARPRPAPSNVDRFLEEIDRRRREAATRPPVTPPRPLPAPPEKPKVAVPGGGEIVIVPPVALAERAPAAAVVVPPVMRPAPVVTEAAGAERSARPVRPAMPATAFVPSTVTSASRSIVGASDAAPAATERDRLMSFLQDRDSLRAAIYLQEILGPPLCRRGR